MLIEKAYLITTAEFELLRSEGQRQLALEAVNLIRVIMQARERAGAPQGLFRITVSFEVPEEAHG